MFLFQITVKPTNFEKLYNGIEGFKLGILRFGMESAILKRVKNKSVLTQNWDMSVPKFSLSLRRFFFSVHCLCLQRNTLCAGRFVVYIKTSLIFLFVHP